MEGASLIMPGYEPGVNKVILALPDKLQQNIKGLEKWERRSFPAVEMTNRTRSDRQEE
jgi:hypothetical protein